MSKDTNARLSDYERDEKSGEYLHKDGSGEYGGEDKCAAMQHLLGWCGCGQPETAQRYVRDGLKLLTERAPEEAKGRYRHMDGSWDAWYKSYRERVDAFFGSSGAEYFFAYWADKEGLTEHGGGVPGWLSGKGEDLIADLTEALAEADKEEGT